MRSVRTRRLEDRGRARRAYKNPRPWIGDEGSREHPWCHPD